MIKSIPRVLYYGIKIVASSVRKTIQEEIELSRELAKCRYQGKETEKDTRKHHGMSLDEAQKILNVDVIEQTIVENQFKHLFSSNRRFCYLRSKIVQAKETIDLELSKTKDQLALTEKSSKSLRSNGKFLFATYVLLNEK